MFTYKHDYKDISKIHSLTERTNHCWDMIAARYNYIVYNTDTLVFNAPCREFCKANHHPNFPESENVIENNGSLFCYD